MVAQSDFKRAREEFEEAADHFDSAARFVDDETFETYYERTQEKATALWQAADWLSKSASEYSSGRGAEGQRLRDDAEGPLETARDLGEPVDPDDWPPDEDADDSEIDDAELEEIEAELTASQPEDPRAVRSRRRRRAWSTHRPSGRASRSTGATGRTMTAPKTRATTRSTTTT